MFDHKEKGATVALELTAADAAALTGLIQFGLDNGDPLVSMAAAHLGVCMREAVMKAIPTDKALAEIDSVLAEEDLDDEQRAHVEQIREQVLAREEAEKAPGVTDMSEFEASMLRDSTDGQEPA